MRTLAEYYANLGYPKARWHIGGEHPSLEQYAVRLLESLPSARVLEVGYQSGGFAVPVILAMRERPDFAYVGIDSLGYSTAIDGTVIARYLEEQGVTAGYEFLVGDARECLAKLRGREFDLILVDHHKPLYPRELRAIVRGGFVSAHGSILVHDVLGKAQGVWPDCALIVRAYGFGVSIVDAVPDGLAVVKRGIRTQVQGRGERFRLLGANARIALRETRALVRHLLEKLRRRSPDGRAGFGSTR